MALRIELGGYYPSTGEQSFGELRARHFVDVSGKLEEFMRDELWRKDSSDYENKEDALRDVLLEVLEGGYDDALAADSDVDPEDYNREEWVEENE